MARRTWIIATWTVLAALILGLRFSPDWVRFLAEASEAEAAATSAAQQPAIARALISGAAERGALVIDQKNDLGFVIADPLHQALRWRLLAPAIGRALRLSDWATLGLAHLGCIGLILALVVLGTPEGSPFGLGGLWLALVAGATAPVITSLGWLGYYDSLLALGLLVVAFTRHRGAVAAACLLTPWVDERFVVALPLALLVRWNVSSNSNPKAWLRHEAAGPIVLTLAFTMTRLSLGGTGGSQTVGDYIRTFIFGQEITLADRIFGAWSGLRMGWVIIVAGLGSAWLGTPDVSHRRAAALGLVTFATLTVGLASAQDTARATVLIIPLLPWAWASAIERWPRPWRWIGPMLALGAIFLPAHQVFGRIYTIVPPASDRPADHPLVRAENNLGYLHDQGVGRVRNPVEAAKWYRRAAEAGLAEAQFNLAMLLLADRASPKEKNEIERWLVAAARQGLQPARRTLIFLYHGNHGFKKELTRAWAWLSLAGEQPTYAADLFAQLGPEGQIEATRIKRSLLGEEP
jgi:hypothetical protein